MLVKILVSGPYADFETKPGFQKAQNLTAGDEVDFPEWYALSLVESELAEATTLSYLEEAATAEDQPASAEEPEGEAVAEIDATDSARDYAAKNNIDLSQVSGTGANGRITLSDVKGVDG